MATSIRVRVARLVLSTLALSGCGDDRVIGDGDGDGGDEVGGETGGDEGASETTGSAENGPPEFVEPLAEGMVVDLAANPCVEIDIVVEDPDGDDITLANDPPIEGGMLASDPMGFATWTWCPSDAQVSEAAHEVVFKADDGNHEPVLKSLLIQLR